MRARRRFLSFFGQRKLILQKLHERAGFARLQAGMAPKPRVGRVEAARNRLFVDLDLLINAGAGRSDTSFSSFGALGGHPFRDFVFPSVPAGKSKKRAPFRIGWGDLNAGMSSK